MKQPGRRLSEQYQLAGAGGIDLRMAESKSAEFTSKINEPSEFSRYVHPLTALKNFPRSEWPQPVTACATGPTLAAQSSQIDFIVELTAAGLMPFRCQPPDDRFGFHAKQRTLGPMVRCRRLLGHSRGEASTIAAVSRMLPSLNIDALDRGSTDRCRKLRQGMRKR
jgi:hypothetical protein